MGNYPYYILSTDYCQISVSYIDIQTFAEALEDNLLKAEREKLPPADILYLLAAHEVPARQQRLVKTRILQAGFPTIKTIDAFDFSFPKAINKNQILNLLDLTFLNQKNNVILMGPQVPAKPIWL